MTSSSVSCTSGLLPLMLRSLCIDPAAAHAGDRDQRLRRIRGRVELHLDRVFAIALGLQPHAAGRRHHLEVEVAFRLQHVRDHPERRDRRGLEERLVILSAPRRRARAAPPDRAAPVRSPCARAYGPLLHLPSIDCTGIVSRRRPMPAYASRSTTLVSTPSRLRLSSRRLRSGALRNASRTSTVPPRT